MRSILMLILALGCQYAYAQKSALKTPIALESQAMDIYLKHRQPATLTIKVINSTTSLENTPVEYTLVQPGPDRQSKKHTKLSKEGTVKIILPENIPNQQIWLNVEGFLYAGIYVNEALDVIINAAKGKNFYMIGDGVEYSGADGELNTAMNRSILFKQDEWNKLDKLLSDKSILAANDKSQISAFIITADSIYRQLQAINDQFISKNPKYAWAIRNETSSLYYSWLVVPFGNYEMPDSIYKKANAHQPLFVSNDGMAFYRQLADYILTKKDNPKIDFQKVLYANYEKYNTVQKAVLDSINYYEQLHEDEKNKYSSNLNVLFEKRKRLFSQELSLIWMDQYFKLIDNAAEATKADLLKISLMKMMKDDYKFTYPALLQNIHTEWCKQLIQFKLNEAIARQREVDSLFAIAKRTDDGNLFIGKSLGRLAFGADMYRLDSLSKANDFIINLKSRFKNKAIIIDFWATWCGPCLSDMPYSKKLHENNSDLPIAYVYLCTTHNSNETIWKSRVTDTKAPGTHIFVEDTIYTELKKIFNAEGGFPTYVVIDLKGNASGTKIHFMGELDRERLKQIIEL